MDYMNKFSKYFVLSRRQRNSVCKMKIFSMWRSYSYRVFSISHSHCHNLFFLRYFCSTFFFFVAFVYLCDMKFLYVEPFCFHRFVFCCSVVLKFVFMFGRRPGYRAGLIDKDILVVARPGSIICPALSSLAS